MIQTIQYKERRIRFKEQGKGNALVLLHGFAEALDIWNEFSDYLSGKFKVISIDLPGHGQSECLSEIHSMEDMAEVVQFVLQHLQIKTCTMIGHSMGGYVTLAYAEKYPNQIKGLALFHSTALPDSEEKKNDRTRTIEIVKENRITFITELINKLFAPQNQQLLKEEIEAVKQIGQKTTAEGIIGALIGMRDRIDRTHVLKKASSPVLFILGKNDVVIPIDKIISLISVPKHSETLILENCGHMGFIESKKETLFSIEKFTEFCHLTD